MNVGERIKQRRKELGLSVEDVAKLLNKNRATVYRYESNDIENLPITILEPLAKILKTTPAILMGWGKEELKDEKIVLGAYEKVLIQNYRKLNEIGKSKIIEYSNDLTKVPSFLYNDNFTAIAAHEKENYNNDDLKHDLDIMDDENF